MTFAYKDNKNHFTLTKKYYGKYILKYLYDNFSVYKTFGNIFIINGYSEPYVRLPNNISYNN